ncbi:MAG: PQQ-binding-like beta-propeller repeat protein [Planctomycetes bacterium]|nr:PQQ-binding-like beta-propeller repeat protein [Planctomycetota bacterium]
MRVLATSSVGFFHRKPQIANPLVFLVIAVLQWISLPNAQAQSPGLSLWTRSEGEDWPRMLGVHYDSKSSETGILTQWPKEGLKVVWTQKTGTGYGNGVAALGRWFQFDRFGNSERLSCYEAQTGKFLWKWESSVSYQDAYGYNDGPRCSPLVDGRSVYVYGVAGKLACIDIQTGKESWQKNINSEYGVVPNFFGVGASPLVYNDLLIVMVGGSPKRSFFAGSPTINDMPNAKPDGTGMIAFDKRTGKEVYRVGNYLASYSAPILARIDGVDYCLSLMREGLLIFQAKDGKGEKFFPFRAAMLESVNAASPVVIGNKIFISEAYEIGSALLEFKDGELKALWRDTDGRQNQLMRTHWNTPLLHENKLYASSGRNPLDTDIRCIELSGEQEPKLVWSKRNRDRGTGLIVDSHWLWLGEFGKLHLMKLGAQDHEVLAQMDLQLTTPADSKEPLLNPPSWAPPVLSHGLLYVRGADRVICLELIPETK